MKKLLISLVLITAFFYANAQQKHVIKTNPIALAFGSFNATYEKVLDSKSSVLISGNYMFKFFGVDVKAGGVGLGYRYYFTHAKKDVPTGFYVNPETAFSFGSVNVKTEDASASASFASLGLGAEIGYQWAWSSGFALDLGIGPMYRFILGNTKAEGENGTQESNAFGRTGGIAPAFTLAIGYAF